jgi:hypothetical protein
MAGMGGGPGGMAGMGGGPGGMAGMGGGPGGMAGGMGGMGSGGDGYSGTGVALKPLKDANGKEVPPDFAAPLSEFVVQFAWKPRLDPEGGSAAGGLPSAEAAPSEDGTTTDSL